MQVKKINFVEYSVYFVLTILLIKVNSFTLALSLIILILVNIFKFKNLNLFDIPSKAIKIFLITAIGIFILQLFRLNSQSSVYLITSKELFAAYGEIGLLLLIGPSYNLVLLKKEKFLNNIEKIGYSILIIKTIIWLLYNFFNLNLGFYEFGGRVGWGRAIGSYYLYRLNGTYIDGLLFAYAVVNIIYYTSLKVRMKNLVKVIFLFLFAFVVYQSRVEVIYFLVTLFVGIVYYAFHSKNKYLSVLLWIILIFIVVVCNLNSIQTFISSFSLNDINNGGSTYRRIIEYNFFENLWKNTNLWLGFGFFPSRLISGTWVVDLSDLGIIRLLYQFGILGTLIGIIPFLIGIYYSFNILFEKDNTKIEIFILLLTSYYTVSCSNFYPYQDNMYPLLPIYLGILLYTIRIHKNKLV